MDLKIALAGNPNCGKTTLFNALTGSNQFVGNWPGVTVEKKEGRIKKYEGVILTDLPGIYSLSPYTLEEVVARNYLVDERPDVVLNIVDGTNLERNLYLTTQLTELGIPVVIAINMMDIVRKNGDIIDIEKLSKAMGCPVFEVSALKEEGLFDAIEACIEAARHGKTIPRHHFSGEVEHAIAHIEEAAVHGLPEEQQRWYAIKIFERDEKVLKKLQIDPETLRHIEKDIVYAEEILDDDAESIITNERYLYVDRVIKGAYIKKHIGRLSTSEKIDRVVTNRWAALPIFMAVIFLVYFISVTTVGTWVTDWTNDGLFGNGWYLFGIGRSDYEEAVEEYTDAVYTVDAYLDTTFAGSSGLALNALRNMMGSEDPQKQAGAILALKGISIFIPEDAAVSVHIEGEAGSETRTFTKADYIESVEVLKANAFAEPQPEDFGIWVPGVPVLIGNALEAINCAPWLSSMILDGIVAGVGAVLGFVPQILVLFLFLSFLEACGYMSRVAFVLDRLFRKFGLSGKSFIPILVGTGCGVPGIMASRTIENERDRRMTVITTTFIPCGAKLPIIAMITAAFFGGPKVGWWVAPVAYFMGIAAIVLSGIILKKTKLFAGDPAPFVMELPSYHMPTFKNLMRATWDRGWSFIKKAGTIILLSTIFIWFLSSIGTDVMGQVVFCSDDLQKSSLEYIGNVFAWIFAPLGFHDPIAAVATLMGLLAKEEVVAVFGIASFEGLGKLAGFSFMAFNLLCAPCVAAMAAIKREMQSGKWTAFAIGYQCVLAYAVSLMIYQFGAIFSAEVKVNAAGLIAASLVLGGLLYLLFRPMPKTQKDGLPKPVFEKE